MRQAIIGSSVIHGALLIVLFAVRVAPVIIVPGPETINVALVEPSAIRPQPQAPAPEPERVIKAPEIKPQEDVGVKLSPPKPKPKPKQEEKKVEEVKPVEPAPAQPTLPYASVGNAGLRGAVSVDAADFEFTYYLVLVRNRVAQAWNPPAGLVTRGQPVRSVVYFRIGRSGELSAVRLETASSFEYFDRSTLRAVTISNPMPPLPLGYAGSDLGVHFGFEYAGP